MLTEIQITKEKDEKIWKVWLFLIYYDKIYFNDYEKLCKRSPYIAKSIKKQTKESTKK